MAVRQILSSGSLRETLTAGNFEIGSESCISNPDNRNLRLDCLTLREVQSEISDFMI